MEQHFSTEFSSLKLKYKVERVSGDSELKISFTNIVERNDIIICTAQILENYLERASSGEDEGVKLSGRTLQHSISKFYEVWWENYYRIITYKELMLTCVILLVQSRVNSTKIHSWVGLKE